VRSEKLVIARTFRDLKVYQRASAAADRVYSLSKKFPREERYSLTDQIRRSSRAVKAMIAEAWGRRRYKLVFISKLDEALGEATEVQSWLDDCISATYLTKEDFDWLNSEYVGMGHMLSRMIDRADDFCKYAPATDYRNLPRVEESEPMTDHSSRITVLSGTQEFFA
jgi:four helix bundle protein